MITNNVFFVGGRDEYEIFMPLTCILLKKDLEKYTIVGELDEVEAEEQGGRGHRNCRLVDVAVGS